MAAAGSAMRALHDETATGCSSHALTRAWPFLLPFPLSLHDARDGPDPNLDFFTGFVSEFPLCCFAMPVYRRYGDPRLRGRALLWKGICDVVWIILLTGHLSAASDESCCWGGASFWQI